jgi:hypothetical protein
MNGRRWLVATLLGLVLGCGLLASLASAEPLSDDGGAEWRLSQPEPPEPPVGVEPAGHLVGLGHVGDLEFEAPNRGALITAGNGSTVPAGVWLYNGVRWRELSTVCGATDGRIAWSGPDEFWTVSNGRPGQAPDANGNPPPLEDDSLCRFGLNDAGRFEVLDSYATLAFQSTSYLPMHGAACLSANDCWFGGDPLQAPAEGAFQLHWNGSSVLAEPYTPEGHAVEEMRTFERSVFQSLRLLKADTRLKQEETIPSLRQIVGEGATASYAEPAPEPPLYLEGESRLWVQALALGSDGEALWGAAGPSGAAPETAEHPTLHEEETREPGVAVVRYSKTQWSPEKGEYVEAGTPSWSEVFDPNEGKQAFGENMDVEGIAAEPGTNSAWLALDPESDYLGNNPSLTEQGRLVRVSADGTTSDAVTLPESGGSLGPKGAILHVTCPGEHDCWAVSAQGWLFHLGVAGEGTAGPPDAAFAELPGELPITSRPLDESVPEEQSVALPEDNSEEGASSGPNVKELLASIPSPFATIPLPLVSNLHSRLIHHTTLELSFRLAVKARVRLVAKRKKRVVASTHMQTLKKGAHKLLLKLNAKRWPTNLDLQTHALAPLPTTNTRESNIGTIGTSELAPIGVSPAGWSRLP